MEIPYYLGGVMDGAVVKTVLTQRIEIGRAHLRLTVRQFGGIHTERPISRRQICRSPIAGHVMDKRVCLIGALEIICDLFPEVVRVCLRSVVTVHLCRNHGRK